MSATAVSKPNPSRARAAGPPGLRCGAPLLDVMGNPPYLSHLCKCSKLRRADLAAGAALLICAGAIMVWGCL